MREDYLWDGSGEPDPEIQKLEATLGKFRYVRPAPRFPDAAWAEGQVRHAGFLPLIWRPRWAAAVLAVVVTTGVGFLFLRSKPTPVPSGWEVTRVEGAPHVGTEIIATNGGTGKLMIGQVLETDSVSRASIRAERTGEIDLEPGTRLRLLNDGAGKSRLALDRGSIRVAIWAPPGEFVVDTPSAIAVDLGCVYFLRVDDSGNGLLHTTLGWVGFKFADRESFIPAGAACPTRKKTGPGIPYFENASQPLRAALGIFELESSTSVERADALRVVLSQARKSDALTLWHLLSRVEDSERGRVYDRLTQLVPAPPGVTREGILHLDQKMLDLWWNDLGLGDISLWRHWEHSWSRGDGKK